MPRAVKIIVACVLLALLALGVDWETLPSHVVRLDWRLAGLGLAAVGLEMAVNASKWSWSLRLHDLRFPWIYLFRSGCFGYFFNNFLPSAIGGDVYRVYRTITPGVERSRPVSAVLVERIVGFGAMLVLGAIGALLLVRTSELARWYLWAASSVAAGVLVTSAAFLLGWLDRLQTLLARIRWLEPVRTNLRRVRPPRFEWVGLIVASCVFQMLAIAVIYLAFAAAGSPISVATAAVITAAAGIASVLPISISGLGVVEGSIVGTAVGVGIDYDVAVIAAVVVRLLTVVVGAGCGLLYLIDSGSGSGARPPSPEIAA